MWTQIWSKALNFILDEDNQRFLLLIAVGLLLAFGVHQCDAKKEAKAEVDRQKNNIEALNDVTSYYMNLAGEETATRLAFQTDKEQLETLNEELYAELRKERDKVEQLTQLNAELSSDTTQTDTTTVFNPAVDQWRFNWDLSKEGRGWSRQLQGFTHFYIDDHGIPYNPTTLITTDRIMMQIITGITERNGQKRIFARSTYPDMTITEIQGAIIRDSPIVDKPSRFGIGLSLGYGIGLNAEPQPFVGVTLNYNLIRF